MFGGINLPPKTNKRYYPRIWTICNLIFFERQKLKKSLIDQVVFRSNLKQKAHFPFSE